MNTITTQTMFNDNYQTDQVQKVDQPGLLRAAAHGMWANKARFAKIMVANSIIDSTVKDGYQWLGVPGLRGVGYGGTLSSRIAGNAINLFDKELGNEFKARGGMGVLNRLEERNYKSWLSQSKKAGAVAGDYSLRYRGGISERILRFFSGDDKTFIMKKTAQSTATTAGQTAATTVGQAASRHKNLATLLHDKEELVGWNVGKSRIGNFAIKHKFLVKNAARITKMYQVGAIAAQAGWWVGKRIGGAISRKIDEAAQAVHSIGKHDVMLAPQFVNKYSMSIREKAMRAIYGGDMSPRNNLVGKEGIMMHR